MRAFVNVMGKFPVLRDAMGASCRQENVGEGVPIRRDAIVFLTDRKLSFTLNSQVVNNYGVNQCDLFFPQCL